MAAPAEGVQAVARTGGARDGPPFQAANSSSLSLSLVSSCAPRQYGAVNLALSFTLEDEGNTRPCEIIVVMADYSQYCSDLSTA